MEAVDCGNKNTASLTGLIVIATADGNYDFAICDAVWFTGSRQEGGCFASRGTGLNLTGDMRPHSFKREWSPLSITGGKVFRKKAEHRRIACARLFWLSVVTAPTHRQCGMSSATKSLSLRGIGFARSGRRKPTSCTFRAKCRRSTPRLCSGC